MLQTKSLSRFCCIIPRPAGGGGHFEEKAGIWPRECARTIENISRIRMDVARASGDEIWTKSVFDRERFDF